MSNIGKTVKSAHTVLNDTRDNAAEVAGRAHSALVDGMHMAASAVTMLRGLGVADALRWVGLERRRSPAVPVVTFAAGVVVGAGIGLLFAPMSGADARRAIAQRSLGLEKQAEKAANKTAADLADKAKDALNRVADVGTETASSARNAVGDTLGDAGAALTDAENAVKRAEAERSAPLPGRHDVS